MKKPGQIRPNINPALLWEYDWEKIDIEKSAALIIERVIQRGRLSDWRAMVSFFGKAACRQVAQKSRQLSRKDQAFCLLFLESDLLHA